MKYIIDVPSDLYTVDETLRVPVKVGNGDLSWYNTYIKAEPYTEPDRKVIEDEMWDFATAINYMGYDDFVSCFGGKTEEAVYELSYSEVKAEYEAWKRTKDEIRVGDEVEYKCCGKVVKFIITGVSDSIVYGFKSPCGYDDVGEYCDIEDLRKTGRHFPEVAELLKKIRGEEE